MHTLFLCNKGLLLTIWVCLFFFTYILKLINKIIIQFWETAANEILHIFSPLISFTLKRTINVSVSSVTIFYEVPLMEQNIFEQVLWNTITLAFPCADWSLETCTECGESKCIEQSMLGKEPESTYQLWQMQLWWIQIELFRLRGIGLDGKKIIGLCSGVYPSCCGTMTTAKAKQRSPSIIRCNMQLISIFVFCVCITVRVWVREKATERWGWEREVYFNPDLINAPQEICLTQCE